MNSSALAHVHVVGIGGSGMSGLATLLLERGERVSGSDLKASHVLDRLRALGAEIWIGHSAEHLGEDVTALAYSTAIARSNPEVLQARERGIPVISRADLLVELARGRRVVGVAGTHGKTTTTSMLALSLARVGADPAYLIGGELNEVGSAARWGEGVFVVEADESDGTFLALEPELAIVTNVEADHLDYYGSFDAILDAFRRYISSSVLAPVVCIDDAGAAAIIDGVDEIASYGTSDLARYRMRNLAISPHLTTFELFEGTHRLGQVDLPIPGIHNARNATAAIVAGLSLGEEFEGLALALSRFVGVQRRFQYKRQLDGVTFVDDYAHLPTEIRATIQSARQVAPSRLVVVFQPHRYTRTRDQATALGEALSSADVVIVTEVYAAGEDPILGVSGQSVFDSAKVSGHAEVIYEPHRSALAGTVKGVIRAGDLCISMGAGDITLLDSEIAELTAE